MGDNNMGAGENSNTLCYTVTTDAGGNVCLKIQNYGDFVNNKWTEATPYDMLTDEGFSAQYLTAIALANSGYKKHNVTIKIHNGQMVLPYYAHRESGGNIHISDIATTAFDMTELSYIYYAFFQLTLFHLILNSVLLFVRTCNNIHLWYNVGFACLI
jgi:hypothetical protein